ncbi:sensor histidine kinase N-terminal domain-containing protein [Dechloromonas sp. XY25]|uniref:histidine kinase n=1 Tax=Dechloromonas hankyongensis TaxID=2908002 RepID=A0ABS9JZN8_9RHOO|nr:sensor histidine kinase [Dechloromonas hankyongensis]MCG2576371.1 sensor histidine kinase N-terminal domain-containing protein [Dechloromonas hankyongensis]
MQGSEAEPASLPRKSLKRGLVVWLVGVLSALLLVDAWYSYRDALAAANQAYDRSLSASLKGIAERIYATESEVVVDIPYSALELFEAGSSDRVFYGVTYQGGEQITGYEGLPLPPTLQPNVAVFYDGVYNGQALRLGAMLKPLYRTEFPRPVIVILGETTNSRQEVVQSLFFGEVGRKAVLVVVALAVALLATRRAFKPIERLGGAIRSRLDDDLTPIEASEVPREVAPLVYAINQHMGRINKMVEARRRFIADAAHQLRTPLAVLNTQAEYALRQHDEAAMRPAVEAFHKSLGSAIRLTNQLLSLSRAEPVNGLALAPQPVDMAALAGDMVVELLPLAARKHIDLGVEGMAAGCGAATVSGQAVLLRELIANLIDNAIRYTPEGGLVTVGVACEDSGEGAATVVLTVTDNGPGIPASERERVFLRFFRLDAGDHQGSGLGLSIVREIVHGHAGEIALDDAPDGRGLRVVVRLPAA